MLKSIFIYQTLTPNVHIVNSTYCIGISIACQCHLLLHLYENIANGPTFLDIRPVIIRCQGSEVEVITSQHEYVFHFTKIGYILHLVNLDIVQNKNTKFVKLISRRKTLSRNLISILDRIFSVKSISRIFFFKIL